MVDGFKSTFDYKLIYVFRINDKAHKDLLKIGDATIHTKSSFFELAPCCKELNAAANARIRKYTQTAGISYELLHTEVAIKKSKNGYKAFRDKAVHDVLIRSGINKHSFKLENQGVEWFKVDLKTAINAIKAVKDGKMSLNSSEITKGQSPIIFRPEQLKAISQTITQFKVSDRMLWNAKMRFGKTLTALQVAKEMKFQKTIIFTHRPVVSDGWYEDFNKIFKGTDYVFGSKNKGEIIENLVDSEKPYVYFASIQDLRGSSAVGGKFDKNEFIFLIDWDFVVIDEAHEGTKTSLGKKVIERVLESSVKTPKLLELSGTPFNLLANYNSNEIFTWDYIMEQKAKEDWLINHFGDSNPYEELPQLEIFTYNLEKNFAGYLDLEDSAFNFREFFRTWTGFLDKDFQEMPAGAQIGDFVHEKDVLSFLNLLTNTSDDSNYPFSKEEYRDYYRHTLWVVPGVKEGKALKALMQKHPVFGSGAFNIVNVAGETDDDSQIRDALAAVKNAISKHPENTYSITITCGKLTTGVTVPEWTGVLMLAGSFSTSAANYMQTIFRVQTPANINGKIKERCSVFDFAPDRALKMVAETRRYSVKEKSNVPDRDLMGDFLNYCSVIAVDGSSMKLFDVDNLLRQLKKVYIDRVVRNGFDDKHIYNDNLLKLDALDIEEFEKLKKIVGSSKPTTNINDIEINNQGFTEEEFELIEKIQKKKKKERTPEELELLEQQRIQRENAKKAISILREISIRIPLLIYGADVDINEEITVDNFVDLIDDASWIEFMPAKLTKNDYKKFSKYYDQDVFVAAGKQVRKLALSADELLPEERIVKISNIMNMFKNPDKETVLTPWRVVNLHLSECIGGYCFFDNDFVDEIENARFVDKGNVTKTIFDNPKSKILEINSKTGLYPLYVVFSLYKKRVEKLNAKELTIEKHYQIWDEVVKDNLYVVCKTPMAKMITKRTLLGYRKSKLNAHAFNDLTNQIKEKRNKFVDKISKGAFWNKEDIKMKFDAIVGNPPYQLMDGGAQASAMPIYNSFVDAAKDLRPNYISMIMPARWYAGGKGLDSFRESMLIDKRINKLIDFPNSADCFPSLGNRSIKGGICFFLWDREYHDKCMIKTFSNGKCVSVSQRFLKEPNCDIFIRDAEALSIMEKVRNYNETPFSTIVSARKPFDFATNFTDFSDEKISKSQVLIYANKTTGYIDRNKIKRNQDCIDKYKLFMPEAIGNADVASDRLKAIIAKDNTCCTETYLLIGPFETEEEAIYCNSYINTRFFHYLLSLKKITQHTTQKCYDFIPIQDFKEKWDDDKLFKKYGLTEKEIDYIKRTVWPKK